MNGIYYKNLIDLLVSRQKRRKRRENNNFIILESQDRSHPAGRKSYFAADPEIEFISWKNLNEIRTQGVRSVSSGNPWDVFSRIQRENPGWWFGYFGYDLKNRIVDLASLNDDPVSAPDLYMMQPQVLVEIDHTESKVTVLKGNRDSVLNISNGADIHRNWKLTSFRGTVERPVYEQKIRESQNRIQEGDFYEINLSHQLQAQFEGNPYDLYKEMRENGPVPFGAYLEIENVRICSMSPERFLQKNGSDLMTQPIKGTAPRDNDVQLDILNREELRNEKNLAENLMIVDLVRHDLSKVSVEGSVRVTNLFEVQSFETLHQLISTIQSTALPSLDPVEIIRNCFPMGSMTGAPKISVMKAIDELENYKRGIYSGAIGYFTPDNDFDFNVVIRTAIIVENSLYYSVGGAITSDSIPSNEWDETILKAKALTGVLQKEKFISEKR
ncbi:MAG: anthranilate synthase component I family protein [Balneolaceae bacterium]